MRGLSSARLDLLALKFITRFREPIEPSPNQAIHSNYHQRDENGGQQQDGEAAAVSRGIDLRAEANGLQSSAGHAGVLGKD